MSPAGRVRTVFLDVNGTLTDPAAIGAVWKRPELGERVLAHAVHTAAVDALLTTAHGPFSDHLRAAVEVIAAEADVDGEGVERALAVAAGLPARPGAAAALERLRAAGMRVLALTNSGAAAGTRTLEANGLIDHVDGVLGVDGIEGVATFKPDPRVYAYALGAGHAGDPGTAALLATHPWDLAGAAQAGMRTAWVRHGSRVWPSVFPAPDVAADALQETAERLAEVRSG